MMETKKYKEKPVQFYSVASGVQNRLEIIRKIRKSKRLTIFDSIRNIHKSDNPQPAPAPTWGELKINNRRRQLAIWKAEKEEKKKEALGQKKKPFLTGIAQLPLQFVPVPPIPKSGTSGREPRSQSKTQSSAPKNAQYRAPEQTTVNKPVLAPPLRATKGEAITKDAKREVHPKTSRINDNKIFEAQNSSLGSCVALSVIKKQIKTLSSTKSTKEKKIKNPKILHLESITSEESSSSEEMSVKGSSVRIHFVRYSTDYNLSSSGSESISSVEDSVTVRKLSFSPKSPSKTLKHSFDSVSSSRDVEFISQKDLSPNNEKKIWVNGNCFVHTDDDCRQQRVTIAGSSRGHILRTSQCPSSRSALSLGQDDHDMLEEDSVEHFRSQLASATQRMKAQCYTWAKTLEQAGDRMPDTAQGLVRSAVGQTRLLTSQKLKQFAWLVERCANPASGAPLVTPADLRGFWDMVSIQVVKVEASFKNLEELRAHNWVEKKPAEVKKKAVPKAGAKKAVKSRLKDMTVAARKTRKDQELQPRAPVEMVPPSELQKTFEAGFFCVISPVKPPATFGNTSRL